MKKYKMSMFTLLDNLESIKHKLTDQEYKMMCDNMKAVYEKKEGKVSQESKERSYTPFYSDWDLYDKTNFLYFLSDAKSSDLIKEFEIDGNWRIYSYLSDPEIQNLFKDIISEYGCSLKIENNPFKVKVTW